MYVYVLHAYSVYKGLKRALDLLKLELETVVSCHWVVGSEPGFSGRATSILKL